MERDEMFRAITAQRSNLIDQLESLTDQQWNAPSLCEGWTVRHVVGHLVSLLTVPTWRFLVGAPGMSGFHRRADKFAREFGERDRPDLMAAFGDLALMRKAPPLIGPMSPLMDLVVHSLDISKPLGLPSIHEAAPMSAVLDAMSRGFPVMAPRSRTKGLTLHATDLDYSTGTGPVVRGASGDLALALSGRPGALDDLEGDGAPLLRARLAR